MAFEEQEEGLVVFSAARGHRMAMNNNFVPAAKPSKIKLKEYMAKAQFFSPWGENDNLWPHTVMDALQGCAPAQVAIEILVTLFYGNGIAVYKETDGVPKKVTNAKQREWFRKTFIHKYLMEAATDYFTFGNQFPQLIRNKGNKGFATIANISAPFCRLQKREEKDAYSKALFIHGSWKNLPGETDCERVLMLPDYYADEILTANANVTKFMMHVGSYTPGHIYYHDEPWHALVRNGTLDIFPEIPKIRKRRIKNAMFIKYHVRINELFWYLKFGGIEKGKQVWESMTTEKRSEARAKFYKSIDDGLSGSENAFKALFSASYNDPRTGVETKAVQLEKIETEVGEKAAFDPDKMSNVADVFLAFGIPSAVANTVLSDNKSRGGGSDIREGNTSVVTRMPMIRHNIFTPIDFAMRNTMIGDAPLLAEDEYLGIENDLLSTLDKSKNGIEPTAPK